MEGGEATGSVEEDTEVAGEGRTEGGWASVGVDLGAVQGRVSWERRMQEKGRAPGS